MQRTVRGAVEAASRIEDGGDGLLEPIERPDLVDDVYARLRQAIFTGELAPGERLVEDVLASQLGVSRAPIRDALKALVRDGLVASSRRRGKIVMLLSPRDAWEVYSLRSTLEAMAIRLVMPSPAPELLEDLEATVDAMEQASLAGDHQALSSLDVQFHETLIRASGHERLFRTWESMSIQIRLLSRQVIDNIYSDLERVPGRHGALIAAIRAGDSDAAEVQIRNHIDSVADRIGVVLTARENQKAEEEEAPIESTYPARLSTSEWRQA